MSRIFFAIIAVQVLMVYFCSVILESVQAKSAGSLISSPRNRNFRLTNLQEIYPVLRNQRLTDNMLSLIHNLKNKKLKRKRLHRMKRKSAFVVRDLEGSPMLVVRKRNISPQSNYPTINQQPPMYDPQKLRLFAPGLAPNFQVSSNMVPFQQIFQPLPYNLENPNFGIQRQLVVPQPVNVFPQPGPYQTNYLKAAETQTYPNNEYHDNFELIPLRASKSRNVLKKDATVNQINSTIGITTAPESSSTTSLSSTSALQISELLKQTIPKEAKELNQTKGIVNAVSLLASVLEQAFSVPHEVVLPNVKHESTSVSSVDKFTQGLANSTTLEQVSFAFSVPQVVLPNVKRESTPANSMNKFTQGLASSTLEQVFSTSSISMDKIIQDVINSALSQTSVITYESTPSSPMPDSSSTMEQITPITNEVTPFNIKRAETFKYEDKTTPDWWKDFQFSFSIIDADTTRIVLPELVVSSLPDKLSSTDVEVKLNKYTSEDITNLQKSFTKPSDDFNPPRRKFEDKNPQCSNTIEQIFEIVKDIQAQEADTKNKEDLPCNITGSWSSLNGGVLLNISINENHTDVVLSPKTPPSKEGFLLQAGWQFKLYKPFSKNEVIIVYGLNEKCKTVASFVGECRICDGESITGNWLLGRPSRNCRDQKASQKLLSDVWSRETLTGRRKEKLKNIKNHSTKTPKENVKVKSNKKIKGETTVTCV